MNIYRYIETFSYRWWNIKVENQYQFSGVSKISFSLDADGIFFAILSAFKKSGTINSQIKSILETASPAVASLSLKTIDSITVDHFVFSSNYREKCREDAKSHIDSLLGDGLSYIKKNNLLPDLNIFF